MYKKRPIWIQKINYPAASCGAFFALLDKWCPINPEGIEYE
jgi:hypothetical protein